MPRYTLRMWAVILFAATLSKAAVIPRGSHQRMQSRLFASSKTAPAVRSSPQRISPGYRAWPNRRCADHYREETPVGGATITSCLEVCRQDEQCAKTTLRPNSTSPCYLFDTKASCTAAKGWSTVFTDLRCGRTGVGKVLELGCPFGTYISEIKFASYGTPAGDCSNMSIGSCHSKSSQEIVSDLCVGENACTVAASGEVFGDPCPATHNKELAVHVSCEVGPDFNEDTYFNAWSLRHWAHAETQIEPRVEEWTSFMKALPDFPSETFSGRGIVIVAGGKYLEPALVMIKMLRQLGCTLRIQVWHLGQHEMTAAHRALLQPYSVETRNFEDYVGPEALTPIEANVGLRLFQLKPLALLHSDLNEILLLDSDNCPIRDPSYLFDDSEFQRIGTAFWPDFWKTSTQNPIWKIIGGFDLDTADQGWEQESGQLLLKKSVAWTAINLAVHLNSDFYMKLLNGDKDTFRFSWLAAGIPFIMIPTWPTPVGTLKELHSTDVGFCGHTMLQHDFAGRALFVHHNQLKSGLLAEGANFQYAKSPISTNHHAKAVPVLGLQLPNRTVLSCLDLRGAEDPNIDDPTCFIHDSGLEEFESMYFDAKNSIPLGSFGDITPKQQKGVIEATGRRLKAQAQEAAAIRLRRGTNTTCTPEEFELVSPTVSTDRVCEHITTCSADQIVTTSPTSTSDRICEARNAPMATRIFVKVGPKSSGHPLLGVGSDSTFLLSRDGGTTYIEEPELRLTRLRTYEFVMDDVSQEHPFMLTLDDAGGWSSSPYLEGVVGSGATGTQSLTVTPGYSTPARLYYQSHKESHEGGAIAVADPTYAILPSDNRFSTAYSARARLFELTAPGSMESATRLALKESCERSCGIRADCVGMFMFEMRAELICYGLSDISGGLIRTSLRSISIRKMVA